MKNVITKNIERGFSKGLQLRRKNMLSIRKVSMEEIIEALVKYQNGEELTDRDLWILKEHKEDKSDEFELFE